MQGVNERVGKPPKTSDFQHQVRAAQDGFALEHADSSVLSHLSNVGVMHLLMFDARFSVVAVCVIAFQNAGYRLGKVGCLAGPEVCQQQKQCNILL